MRGSFDQSAKPLQRRRLSAGKSKLPASLTPQQQSLNKTQQFISSLSKKASVAQVATAANPVPEEHNVEAHHEHVKEVKEEALENHEDH